MLHSLALVSTSQFGGLYGHLSSGLIVRAEKLWVELLMQEI